MHEKFFVNILSGKVVEIQRTSEDFMFNFLFHESHLDFKIHSEFISDSVGAFLINLDRATDRLEFVKPHVDQLGIPVERISAVDGSLLSDEEIEKVCDKERFKKYFKMMPERGTIGCSLSHKKAWRRFLESEYEFALIFEDDVVFNPHELKSCVESAIEKKDLWDVLSFEMIHDGWPVKVANLHVDKWMSLYLANVTHSGCYLLNRNAAKKLLEKFYPIVVPVDHYITASWEFDIKFAGVEPRIVTQNFGNSQIKTDSVQKIDDLSIKISNAVFNIRRSVVRFLYNLYLFFGGLSER